MVCEAYATFFPHLSFCPLSDIKYAGLGFEHDERRGCQREPLVSTTLVSLGRRASVQRILGIVNRKGGVTMRRKDEIRLFAEFASVVISQLPGELKQTVMRYWIQNRRTLARVLRELLRQGSETSMNRERRCDDHHVVELAGTCRRCGSRVSGGSP